MGATAGIVSREDHGNVASYGVGREGGTTRLQLRRGGGQQGERARSRGSYRRGETARGDANGVHHGWNLRVRCKGLWRNVRRSYLTQHTY